MERNLYENTKYITDVDLVVNQIADWSKFDSATIAVVGASSMIGRFFVDVLYRRKKLLNTPMQIICVGRNKLKMMELFNMNQELAYVQIDLSNWNSIESEFSQFNHIDFIVNFASPAGSNAIKNIPIEMFNCNVIGTRNLLDLCVRCGAKYIFSSSLDIYGNNINGLDRISENQNGEIDTMNNRSCYFESKRMAETLCKCYNTQYGVDFFVLRLPRVFGPTMGEYSSSLIINWMIIQCRDGNIPTISSSGEQKYSFLYVSDVVSGIFSVITSGSPNQAYNISDDKCNVRVIDVSTYICSKFGKKLAICDDKEKQQFFEKSLDKVIDSSKLNELGWRSRYSIYEAIDRMIDIVTDEQK